MGRRNSREAKAARREERERAALADLAAEKDRVDVLADRAARRGLGLVDHYTVAADPSVPLDAQLDAPLEVAHSFTRGETDVVVFGPASIEECELWLGDEDE